MLDVSNARFHVVNLGCKVNRVESDSIAAHLQGLGYVAADQGSADLIVVNSCTVTGEADKKTRKAVRAALRANPEAQVVVTGCGVSVDAAAYTQIDNRVKAIERTALFALLGEGGGFPLRMGEGFRSRVNIKVQDGCNHACTYCIVHVARGLAVSVPLRDAVAEAKAYLGQGVKELVLTGIDLGSYRDGGHRLADLVAAMMDEADQACVSGEHPARIRASSVEPTSIHEEFIDLLADSDGRLCRHLHLPLQSGSSKVLHEMARPYTAEYFRDLIAHLHERVPQISLTTDIICGFPGETDEDFAQTLALARACAFSKIHVFPYSRRKGTPAASRNDQVPESVKAQRALALRALSDELGREDLRRRSGTVELAFIEPNCALTESYHEVEAPDHAPVGSLWSVNL